MTAPTSELATERPQGAIDDLAIQTIRFLSVDQVEAANSGHPGLPLGAAPMAWTVFSRHLRHDPADPTWPDRDRFVLSAGHGSALLYSLLHLTGYDVTTEDLAGFRQLGSRTPGHPEYGHTPGVETTTGPLGQGLANAVGMALAEKILSARYPEFTHHRTFALVGDGCLMEGISHEAASLAGRLGLGRLVVLFDDNDITIDGTATSSCADDQLARFAAYGWHTLAVDGEDVEAIDLAIRTALAADDRPSFIAVRTVIGAGAPGIEGTSKAHGSPLGPELTASMKEAAGWPAQPFHIPDSVREYAGRLAARGAERHERWQERMTAFTTAHPERAEQWRRAQAGELSPEAIEALAAVKTGIKRATRQASQEVLTALAAEMPELVGGSADLAGSTGTDTGQTFVTEGGPRIAFGVREHAMAAVMNGLSLHGGLRPYGSTFLVFSDYLRPALRLSALMRQPVIYILTHDSIGVGEDGPTHQPVEHVEALRLIPGVRVFRPCDDFETLAAWRAALAYHDGPSVLVLTRQAVAPVPPLHLALAVDGGGRAVSAPAPAVDTLDVDLLASGSEVEVAIGAAALLADRGIAARVLSVWCREQFVEQRDELGRAPLSVSIEAGVTSGWLGFVDAAIGLDEFGASGPGDAVMEHFGFTAEQVADEIAALVAESR